MIDIYFIEQKHRYRIKALGHADYAPTGYDIVCAAVSTLLQAYGNYIQKLKKTRKITILEIKYEPGDIDIDALDVCDSIKDLYLMTMEALEDIGETYVGYIKFHYNEKI